MKKWKNEKKKKREKKKFWPDNPQCIRGGNVFTQSDHSTQRFYIAAGSLQGVASIFLIQLFFLSPEKWIVFIILRVKIDYVKMITW
jgi:hypothetical protein